MRFAEIVGQNELSARLRKGIRDGRIPHAQMFLGGEGTGNLALALAYAQYLHCSNRTDDDSCGECPGCRKHQGMIHPDTHFSFPFPSNKATVASELYSEWRKEVSENPYLNYELWMQALSSENKQGNIPIKECHAIIKSLSLKPFEGGHKILIMWLPEFLGSEGNVLLKLIEEPPQQTVFLLVAENTEKVLTTIMSRVQITRVPPVTEEKIAGAIQSGYGLNSEESQRIALLSGGNYLRAKELAGKVENKFLEPFRNWMLMCYQMKLSDAIQWADDYAASGREQLKGFFLYSMEILRAVLVFPVLGESQGLSADETSFASRFSGIINSHAKVELMYQWFDTAAYEIERNGNPRIIFTDLSFKLARLMKNKS